MTSLDFNFNSMYIFTILLFISDIRILIYPFKDNEGAPVSA